MCVSQTAGAGVVGRLPVRGFFAGLRKNECPDANDEPSGPGRDRTLMLEAKHVTLSRGTTVLLEDASFLIGPGEKVGLVGVNGAGKTTLLRALHGDIDPDGGSITRPERIGYLGQERLADALETNRTPDIPATVRNVMLAGRD